MPDSSLYLFILIIVLAIGFGFVNGLNDAANTIATVVGTRALSTRNAVILASIFNFAGAATGLEVARTIGKGILIPEAITFITVIAALASVVIWTSLATYCGLPVSLTHGFVASMAAAGMAAVGNGAVVWSVMTRVLTSVVSAPALGFFGGFVVLICLYWLFQRGAPDMMRSIFSTLQIPAAAFLAYSHGKNDGQMPIGVITMAMVAFYNDVSIWDRIPFWVIIVSALAISTGMAIGGRRVIKTLGMRVTNLQPIQGFAAQVSAATVIEAASHFGIPVSTTHCASSAIMGVGATRHLSAVRWGVAGNIVATWIITFPVCGGLGYLFTWVLQTLF